MSRALPGLIALAASIGLGACGGSDSGSTVPTPAPTPAPPVITVAANSNGATIGADALGSNLGVWTDITQTGTTTAMGQLGAHLLRWPGGSDSDLYHWQTNSACNGAYTNGNATFANFVNTVVKPGGYDLALTMNYGSNAACNGGGDPAEAAAWVANAKALGLTGLHWTVGNEVYGSWEYDLHAKPNDAATYAAAVAGANGYYQLAKAQDPTAQIGVVVEGNAAWDTTVLANAPYDFVEVHYYAQNPGQESDSFLLNSGPANLAALITTVKSELAAAGKANTPIYLGEYNSVSSNPGKQSVSIVNGLYAGMAIGEVLNAGLPMATWWQGIGAGCSTGGNNAASLYGWQNIGSYGQMADTWPNPYGCVGAPTIAFGTLMPSGQAMALASAFALAGNHMLSASVPTTLPNVRAYAATQGTGYAVMLFNLDSANAASLQVQISGATGSYTAATLTYGKAQYDTSQTNVWTGPVKATLGSSTGSATLTLPAWSMTVLTLK